MDEAARELRFALLGAPPPVSAWYAAVQASDRHHVVAALASDVSEVRVDDHWQSLVTGERINAALLFSPHEELFEPVRQLATHGKGLVIDRACPLPSTLVAELALFDAEAMAAVVPLFEWRAFPAFHELHQLVSSGRLGEVVLIRIERAFRMTSANPSSRLLSDERVGTTLFPDIDLLRWIGGDYSQVTLFRTGATDGAFAAQTLNLAGEGLPDATCVYRMGKETESTCEVQGSAGIAVVETNNVRTRLTANGETVLTQENNRADPALCLQLLDDGIFRKAGSLRWQDRVRIHEIQEAMQRSLKRRRTIDLHFETTSERSQFKTQMATIGCFVLVFTCFASVMLLLAGAVLDPRDQLQRQAEAAGFVMPLEDFSPRSGRLTGRAEQQLAEIADRWESTDAVVVIEGEPTGELGDEALTQMDRARLESVRQRLGQSGVRRVEERTLVRRLVGGGFQRLMTLGRVIAFAPLGLFLVMQVLLFVSRPAHDREHSRTADAAP